MESKNEIINEEEMKEGEEEIEANQEVEGVQTDSKQMTF